MNGNETRKFDGFWRQPITRLVNIIIYNSRSSPKTCYEYFSIAALTLLVQKGRSNLSWFQTFSKNLRSMDRLDLSVTGRGCQNRPILGRFWLNRLKLDQYRIQEGSFDFDMPTPLPPIPLLVHLGSFVWGFLLPMKLSTNNPDLFSSKTTVHIKHTTARTAQTHCNE